MANKQTVMSNAPQQQTSWAAVCHINTLVGLVLFWLGAVIIGALKTINGEVFVYPFTLQILK